MNRYAEAELHTFFMLHVLKNLVAVSTKENRLCSKKMPCIVKCIDIMRVSSKVHIHTSYRVADTNAYIYSLIG